MSHLLLLRAVIDGNSSEVEKLLATGASLQQIDERTWRQVHLHTLNSQSNASMHERQKILDLLRKAAKN